MTEIAMGIDLGTTYSCVSILRYGQMETIPNDYGRKTTPSYVTFDVEGELIGDASKDSSFNNASNAIFGAKRIIGKRFNDPEVKKNKERWPFTIVELDGFPVIQITDNEQNKTFSPVDISSKILVYLRQTVESYLSTTVTKAVITVPANFTEAQRTATKEAGKMAGLEIIGMINEPTAAALCYGLQNSDVDQKILVFDFGGGTLDVAIIQISNGSKFEVVATAGNMSLGGEDFDEKLLKRFVSEFKNKHNVDLNKEAITRLRLKCESVKQALSSNNGIAHLAVDCLHEKTHFITKIRRSEFECICEDIFSKILEPIQSALTFANLGVDSIDHVVLVGGSSKIPKVQEILQNFFPGKTLHKDINADEAVAQGAALYAKNKIEELTNEVQINEEIQIIEVIPYSLGVRVVDGKMAVIIPRGSRIPAEGTQTCTTSSTNQKTVRIKVYEGEKMMAEENNFLDELIISDIAPAPEGVPLITIKFSYDSYGCLNVTAKDDYSGKSARITIARSNRETSV